MLLLPLLLLPPLQEQQQSQQLVCCCSAWGAWKKVTVWCKPDDEAEEQEVASKQNGVEAGETFSIAMNVSDLVKTPDSKIIIKLHALQPDQKQEVRNLERDALRVVGTIELLVETPTAKQMAEDIRNTEFGKLRGLVCEEGRYVVTTYQNLPRRPHRYLMCEFRLYGTIQICSEGHTLQT